MNFKSTRILTIGLMLALMVLLFGLGSVTAEPTMAPAAAQITILHTDEFHGYLQSDSRGRGGSAYIAGEVNEIRTQVGADNVLLVDAGDVYFAAPPISQLLMGESAIDIYNMMGYDVAEYGNHEFDKGQDVLQQRTAQSSFPWIGANIVLQGTEWDHPSWAKPYVIIQKGGVKVGIIGLITDETPLITLKGTTEGLVFKDLTETVLHYYDEVKAQSDALIILACKDTENSGPYKGLKTVAQELISAGKPVDLMIGSKQYLAAPVMVGSTAIVAAGLYGQWLGRVDATINPATKKLTVDHYEAIAINNTLTPDPAVEARVAYWAAQVAPVIAQPVGYTNVSLVRTGYESNMGDLVADSLRWKADEYDDDVVNGSVDVAFTNPGGLRSDIVIPEGATLPYTITWGDTFNVLPFGNTLYLMDLTGAEIQALLDQAATLYKGILQSSGITWYWYNNCNCITPTAWGAYNVKVHGQPLQRDEVYRVATNSFLAGGGDGWVTFADGTNRWDTYYDMRDGLNDYIQWYNADVGPIDYQVEDRIINLAPQEMTITPAAGMMGYVDSLNRLGNYLGSGYLWTGQDTRPHTPRYLHGVFQFDLGVLPADAVIIGAEVSLTQRSTRYATGDSAYTLNLLSSDLDNTWSDLSYWAIAHAYVRATAELGMVTPDEGAVNTADFSFQKGIDMLQERLVTTGKVSFRLDGELQRAYGRDIVGWDGRAVDPPVLHVTFYLP
jgi:5'-nucleotidase/UDP-sugar diphosphatase